MDLRDPLPDDVIVVMAHGMLNSVSVIRNAAQLINKRGEHDAMTTELVETILDQSIVVAEQLKDMMRGAPQALIDILEDLDERRPDSAGLHAGERR